MIKWLFHQNGFTRTSLSATVTRVSYFAEENVEKEFSHIPMHTRSNDPYVSHNLFSSKFHFEMLKK